MTGPGPGAELDAMRALARRRILLAARRLHRREPLRADFRVDAVLNEVRADRSERLPASHRGGGHLALDDAALRELVDALVADGALTVCSDIPYPPFEVEDTSAESGYSGFDMDIMQEIANRLDLTLSVQDVAFDALQSGSVLGAEQCDIGASAMTITDDRKENLDFSDPYYDSLQSLLVPADSGPATNIGAVQGAPVTVSTDRGSVTLPLVVADLPDRVVWVPMRTPDAAVRRDLAVVPGSVVRISAAPSGAVA